PMPKQELKPASGHELKARASARHVPARNPRNLACASLLMALALAAATSNVGRFHARASGLAATSVGVAPRGSSTPRKGALPLSILPCAETIMPQAGPPQTPTILIAVGNFSYSQINLSWVPAPGADNAAFGLERTVFGQNSFSEIARLCGSITSYSDTSGLVSGTTYR